MSSSEAFAAGLSRHDYRMSSQTCLTVPSLSCLSELSSWQGLSLQYYIMVSITCLSDFPNSLRHGIPFLSEFANSLRNGIPFLSEFANSLRNGIPFLSDFANSLRHGLPFPSEFANTLNT